MKKQYIPDSSTNYLSLLDALSFFNLSGSTIKKLAKESTVANLNEVKLKQGAQAEHEKRALQAAEELKKDLGDKTFTLKMKSGEGGKLYGAVTTADVSDLLKKDGYDIEKKQVVIDTAIKMVGTFGVRIKLHPKVSCQININVEAL